MCQWSRYFPCEHRVPLWLGGWDELVGVQNRWWEWKETAFSVAPSRSQHERSTSAIDSTSVAGELSPPYLAPPEAYPSALVALNIVVTTDRTKAVSFNPRERNRGKDTGGERKGVTSCEKEGRGWLTKIHGDGEWKNHGRGLREGKREKREMVTRKWQCVRSPLAPF